MCWYSWSGVGEVFLRSPTICGLHFSQSLEEFEFGLLHAPWCELRWLLLASRCEIRLRSWGGEGVALVQICSHKRLWTLSGLDRRASNGGNTSTEDGIASSHIEVGSQIQTEKLAITHTLEIPLLSRHLEGMAFGKPLHLVGLFPVVLQVAWTDEVSMRVGRAEVMTGRQMKHKGRLVSQRVILQGFFVVEVCRFLRAGTFNAGRTGRLRFDAHGDAAEDVGGDLAAIGELEEGLEGGIMELAIGIVVKLEALSVRD